MPDARVQSVELRQATFSLTEVAVLLIIAGLLLGLAFKGQDLIHGSSLRLLADDFQTAPLIIRNYQARFRALPGDDSGASTRFPEREVAAWTPASRTLGNGQLDGNWDSVNRDDETYAFWQQARLAGFRVGKDSAGDPRNIEAEPPRNALDGRIGIESGRLGYIAGLNDDYLMCSRAIPGELALELDNLLDDGASESGKMRTVSLTHRRGLPALVSGDVKPGAAYTVCLSF